MYIFVDWMKCTDCGATNTLFKIYKNRRNNELRPSGKCQLCYRERARIESTNKYYRHQKKYQDYAKNRPREIRNAIQRRFVKKHRDRINRERREKYYMTKAKLDKTEIKRRQSRWATLTPHENHPWNMIGKQKRMEREGNLCPIVL